MAAAIAAASSPRQLTAAADSYYYDIIFKESGRGRRKSHCIDGDDRKGSFDFQRVRDADRARACGARRHLRNSQDQRRARRAELWNHCPRDAGFHPGHAGLLHAPAEPGRSDHPVWRISRHRSEHRPSLDLAVDGKKKLSVRANNFISDKIKVNDLRGNPIDIAAQIMWRVVDTAQALFDVDDYKQFVRVQVEAAIRTIGSRYPYDDFAHKEVTLRGNHDEVGAELRKELQERLTVAGITIDECGFTYL